MQGTIIHQRVESDPDPIRIMDLGTHFVLFWIRFSKNHKKFNFNRFQMKLYTFIELPLIYQISSGFCDPGVGCSGISH